MIGNNLVVLSDVFWQSFYCCSKIGLFIYVLFLSACVCLPVAVPEITCFMLPRVPSLWDGMLRYQIIACDGIGWLQKENMDFPACILCAVEEEEVSNQRAGAFKTHQIFCTNSSAAKVNSLWREAFCVPFCCIWKQGLVHDCDIQKLLDSVYTKCLVVTPLCCHLWLISAGSGSYFWGSLWTERAQISTAWSSQPLMETQEGWDTTFFFFFVNILTEKRAQNTKNTYL